jgi:hypothetical protein
VKAARKSLSGRASSFRLNRTDRQGSDSCPDHHERFKSRDDIVSFAAASDAMAGRLEQAHNAVARLRQLNSTLRVSNLKEVLGPYRLAENISQYEEGLRRAGLSE